ncbi:MAG: SRSF protein kinase 3, partial [Paramarteilia canceri]
LFEMATGEYLFNPKSSKTQELTDLNHLHAIFKVMDEFPKTFLSKCSRTKPFFNKNMQLKKKDKVFRESLEGRLSETSNSKDEISKFADFLIPILSIDPNKRLSSVEALELSWLKEN